MKKKISVVIPYAHRIKNLSYVLESLDAQSMDKNDFEIVIGCMEFSEELAKLLNEKYLGLKIIVVMSGGKWNTARARNLALKETTGDVIVFMDADIIAPGDFLEQHYREHQKDDSSKIVLGQMKSYDEWQEDGHEDLPTYAFYRDRYLAGNGHAELPIDKRWQTEIVIPWAMCWTAIVSLPRDFLFENELFFDELFTGWGVEDIEWGFRIARSGAVTVLSDTIWGIHLPHPRDAKANHDTEKKNFRRFLSKWPCLEVETVVTFGDYKGNGRFRELRDSARSITGGDENYFCVFGDDKELFIGGVKDADGNWTNQTSFPAAIDITNRKIDLPLLGLSLPFDDKSFVRINLSSEILKLNPDIRDLVIKEAERIGKDVSLPEGD